MKEILRVGNPNIMMEKTTKLLPTTGKVHNTKKCLIPGHLFRFFGWWFAFSGLYATTSNVCPFCGRICCPVGTGSIGLVGGFFALCIQNWKALVKFIHNNLKLRLFGAKSNRNLTQK